MRLWSHCSPSIKWSSGPTTATAPALVGSKRRYVATRRTFPCEASDKSSRLERKIVVSIKRGQVRNRIIEHLRLLSAQKFNQSFALSQKLVIRHNCQAA